MTPRAYRVARYLGRALNAWGDDVCYLLGAGWVTAGVWTLNHAAGFITLGVFFLISCVGLMLRGGPLRRG